ncbi:TonB-dependent receptor [Flavihumibacter profundi]|uniref:TonB-dependent receptor n=1 Tax=Flavihumibacter profundi TaxID=2716883 RepID=UPI001CC4F3B0|nr:TonB-dependent receptor [Flavihumibacter profundi]MBZ5858595.1 TonB-dependent receptor [Flavihumibacter profundi]
MAASLNWFRKIVFSYLFTGVALLGYAQTGLIKGIVTTSDNMPAASVSIQLKEIKKATLSDKDGAFQLKQLPEGEYTLIASYVGLRNLVKPVSVKAGETVELNFSFPQNNAELQEVVVSYGKGMNEKVVTAGKVAIRPMDLPQSIAVINKDILERQQVLQLSDVLQNVTGIYLMGTTGGYQEEIAGRGYAFTSNNTFKNGARYNNGAMPEMSGVEKVEFLKGGNAILFGNVAAGGVLNIVTKKPKFTPGGEISFRTGSYDFYKPSIDFYGALDRKETVAYRINSTYQKSGSFRDYVNGERFYINPSLFFNVNAKTTLLVEGDYLKDNRTADFGVGAINYTIADVPRSRFLGVPWGYNSAEQKNLSATLTRQLKKDWQIRGMVSYQNYAAELFGAARPANIKPGGTWIRGLQKSKTAEAYLLSQVDLTGKFKTGKIGHTVLVGADADQYQTKANTYITNQYNANGADEAIRKLNIYDTVNIYDPASFGKRNDIPLLDIDRITTSPILRFGLYVQDLVCLSNKFKLLAGVRYSYQNNRKATVDSMAKGSTGSIAAYTNDAFSPRVGLVYQPSKKVSLFTSYTNSFTVNTGRDIYGAALPPSIIDQVELGAKTDLFNSLLSVNITLYQIVNNNLAQTALTLADGSANIDNSIRELAGEVTSKGVELDIATKPVYGFTFMAGYSFNDTRYTGGNGRNFTTGDRLRYNPAHTANASVFYVFPGQSVLKNFNTGFNAYYVGDRLAGRNPSTANPNYKLITLPDYTLFDFSVGYEGIKHFSLRLKLTNILNKLSYNVHDDNSVNPIAPRQFAATVMYKF